MDRLATLFARVGGREDAGRTLGEQGDRLPWLGALCEGHRGHHHASDPPRHRCGREERSETPRRGGTCFPAANFTDTTPPRPGSAGPPPPQFGTGCPTTQSPTATTRFPIGTTTPQTPTPATQTPTTSTQTPTPATQTPTTTTQTPTTSTQAPVNLDQTYRENVVQAAGLAGDGWAFQASPTPQLLDGWGQATDQNDYWRMGVRSIEGQPQSVLQLQPGVDAASAVDDLFQNRQNYAFDCSTAVRVVGLKAELDTLGAESFNGSHADLALFGHYDDVDGRMDSGAWNVSAGPTVDYGAGTELGAFDPSTDQLRAGDIRYFENPGDTTTENQGWNVIYLGQTPQGQDRFWRTGGEFTGGLEGEYLSNLRGTPDLQQLSA